MVMYFSIYVGIAIFMVIWGMVYSCFSHGYQTHSESSQEEESQGDRELAGGLVRRPMRDLQLNLVRGKSSENPKL